MDDVQRELGVLQNKVDTLEKDVTELYNKVDVFSRQFTALESNIKDLTRVIEEQKSIISDVGDIVKSLQLLKKITYIAAWAGGLVIAYKSGWKEIVEWFTKK